ncbi:MAG: DUF4399 domain-containing protein [Burkholderiaceae bacterium]
MIRSIPVVAAILAGLIAPPALAERSSAPAGAKVYFVNLKDGDAVSSPFKVVFGLSGMGVAPAGTKVDNTGHHHLLIDRPPIGEGAGGEQELAISLPADDHHKHFGKGQTEAMVDLPAGRHTLQLLLGNYLHIPHDRPVASEVITITVQ